MNDYTPPRMPVAKALELARIASNPMNRGARMSLGPHVLAALVEYVDDTSARLATATAKLDQLEARSLEDARTKSLRGF